MLRCTRKFLQNTISTVSHMHVRMYREALCETGCPAARKKRREIARSGTTCSVGLTYIIVCGACGTISHGSRCNSCANLCVFTCNTVPCMPIQRTISNSLYNLCNLSTLPHGTHYRCACGEICFALEYVNHGFGAVCRRSAHFPFY